MIRKQIFNQINAMACLLVICLASVSHAQAVRLRMQDGSIWKGQLNTTLEVVFMQSGAEITMTGKLLKAEKHYIMIDGVYGGIKGKKTIILSNLVSISEPGKGGTTQDPSGGTVIADLNSGNNSNENTNPASSGNNTLGVFFLPMSGTVGMELRHIEMNKIAEEADKYGPGQIIVIRLNTGGGLLLEGEDIHDALAEIRKRHRIVAWIEEAISAGCQTAISCDEIYFMTEGTAGSITAFAGTTALKGAEKQHWIDTLGMWMEEGGRSRMIAAAMVGAERSLSYDKDEKTGEVTWYDDLSGEFILSRPGQNLTFNSSNAVHSGFAQGIADTEQELARLLDLPEWKELGNGRKIMSDWMTLFTNGTDEINKIWFRLQRAGIGRNRTETIGKTISLWKDLLRWVDRTPVLAERLGVPDKDVIEYQIKELRRQLARNR